MTPFLNDKALIGPGGLRRQPQFEDLIPHVRLQKEPLVRLPDDDRWETSPYLWQLMDMGEQQNAEAAAEMQRAREHREMVREMATRFDVQADLLRDVMERVERMLRDIAFGPQPQPPAPAPAALRRPAWLDDAARMLFARQEPVDDDIPALEEVTGTAGWGTPAAPQTPAPMLQLAKPPPHPLDPHPRRRRSQRRRSHPRRRPLGSPLRIRRRFLPGSSYSR